MSWPGRGGYAAAQSGGGDGFRCRSLAAEAVRCTLAEQVVFASNASHALEHCHPSLVPEGGRVASSPAMSTTPQGGRCTRWARGSRSPLRRSLTGRADCATFENSILGRSLTPSSARTSPMCLGFVLPIEEIAALCRAEGVPPDRAGRPRSPRAPAVFELDTLGAAFIAMPGHKGLYGPQGTGLLLGAHDAARSLRRPRAAASLSRPCRTSCRTSWRRYAHMPASRVWRPDALRGGKGGRYRAPTRAR